MQDAASQQDSQGESGPLVRRLGRTQARAAQAPAWHWECLTGRGVDRGSLSGKRTAEGGRPIPVRWRRLRLSERKGAAIEKQAVFQFLEVQVQHRCVPTWPPMR